MFCNMIMIDGMEGICFPHLPRYSDRDRSNILTVFC